MTSPWRPSVPIVVHLSGRTRSGDALVDTGFDGDAIVPHRLSEGLQPARRMPYRLIDGTQGEALIFNGSVRLSNFAPVQAEIIALGDDFIIGTGILSRYEVVLDHGRRVIVNP